MIMSDYTDRVDYQPDGDDDKWVLTIRRDVPPPSFGQSEQHEPDV